MQISGKYTVKDWEEFRPRLRAGKDLHHWEEAFEKFFRLRLETRYFRPIRRLMEIKRLRGEGIAIVALQCTLLEFLESTYQGKIYKFIPSYDTDKVRLGRYEYSSSGEIFKNFLIARSPFDAHFDPDVADDFYKSVRCGLLHEARTKNGWIIRAASGDGNIVKTTGAKKIVYRNDFQANLEEAVNIYQEELLDKKRLQKAFLRKINGLCK